ncbi:hypothetical protein BKA62DRAFT_487221 [Auriculariales sp. MPI-PUGE-AT-0066]|nr:hypothetical protein BKA62DRAFT_487221 [Auriculariales sp. MPI-PUGE-AT-0066]
MASPIVIKAKVSGSAKAKPLPSATLPGSGSSSTLGPRLTVRSPGSTIGYASSSPSTPVSANSPGPIKITAKVSRGAQNPPLKPSLLPNAVTNGEARIRRTSTSTSMSSVTVARSTVGSASSRPSSVVHAQSRSPPSTLNRDRTGSMYSITSQPRGQSPGRRPPSPVKTLGRIVSPRQPTVLSVFANQPHSPPGSTLSGQSASTSSLSSPASPMQAFTTPSSPRTAYHAPVTPADRSHTGPVKLRAKITPSNAMLEPPPPSNSVSLGSSRSNSPTPSDASSSSIDSEIEAKINRKIADLEITNTSLLSINASLEAHKTKQQKEIWELRRRLRETRLALPPPMFKQLKSQDGDAAVEEEDDADEPEPEQDQDQDDPVFDRVSAKLLGLIEQCKTAISASAEKVRVLNANELRAWEGKRVSISAGPGEFGVAAAAEGEDAEDDEDPDADAPFETADTDATDALDDSEVSELLDDVDPS